jgi:hypothetical protein
MKAGDVVELAAPAEILATLDDDGCLDGLPFMPEMLRYFDRPFRVRARVERACDTIGYDGVQRIPGAVLLDDVRCEGVSHGGCQARCRLYWKEAWLRPARAGSERPSPARDDPAFERLGQLAYSAVRVGDRFRCQATELLRASTNVSRPDAPLSLLRELTQGNVGLARFARVLLLAARYQLGWRLRLRPRRRVLPYDPTAAGIREPEPRGLRPGELVRVRSRAEIAKTLDENGKNRGLWFDREMLPYCGKEFRVKLKVERFVYEATGRLVTLSSDCYMLEDVICSGERSSSRYFCPRGIYPWWRECWLVRVDDDPEPPGAGGEGESSLLLGTIAAGANHSHPGRE